MLRHKLTKIAINLFVLSTTSLLFGMNAQASVTYTGGNSNHEIGLKIEGKSIEIKKDFTQKEEKEKILMGYFKVLAVFGMKGL